MNKKKKSDAKSRALSAIVCFLLPIVLYFASLLLSSSWPIAVGIAIILAAGFVEFFRLFAKAGGPYAPGIALLIVYMMGLITALSAARSGLNGVGTVFAIQLSAQFYDFTAYAVGVTIGKTKIAEVKGLEWYKGVSPNKTVQGTLGGWIVSIALTAIVVYLGQSVGLLGNYAWVACAVPIFAFIGDSLGSFAKRQAGVKDSTLYDELAGSQKQQPWHALLLKAQGGYIDRYGSVAAGVLGVAIILMLVGGVI
ncbi:MAG: phosphatidate cytidylyltransferase [Candidatus Nomurabacteria bacterium]|jgi:phosphatidate cytidylyltransferase|nr:phosphatidate cytidylyltransferase [Candidatus Nomurabacteria bacterium]